MGLAVLSYFVSSYVITQTSSRPRLCHRRSQAYREHARKLLANLSHKKNTLRERLVAGDIAAYDLVRMNDDALASTEKARLREQHRQNGLAIAKAPRIRAMAGCEFSEMYMCPECKRRAAMPRPFSFGLDLGLTKREPRVNLG